MFRLVGFSYETINLLTMIYCVCIFFCFQNAGRIIRALFEVALRDSHPLLAAKMLELCKTVDKRLWMFENPMRQFTHLSPEIMNKLEAKKLLPEKLREMEAKEIGKRRHPFIVLIDVCVQ